MEQIYAINRDCEKLKIALLVFSFRKEDEKMAACEQKRHVFKHFLALFNIQKHAELKKMRLIHNFAHLPEMISASLNNFGVEKIFYERAAAVDV